MKKIIFTITLILFSVLTSDVNAFAEPDYEILYAKSQEADFRFMHDIDPYQDEDNFKYAWSPYLLFRSSSNLTFTIF